MCEVYLLIFHYSIKLICDNIKELYNRIFISISNTYFSIFNSPVILEHLFEMSSVYFFQFTFLSRVSPKKLNI